MNASQCVLGVLVVGMMVSYEAGGSGTMNFTRVMTGPLLEEVGNYAGASWGDYDGDGDLDLFLANLRGTSWLFRNEGQGQFSSVPYEESGILETSVSGEVYSGAWMDMDNDGDLDLAVATGCEGSQCRLYENKGDGQFQLMEEQLPGSCILGLSSGDLDQDGWLDLHLATWGGPNPVYFQNESGFVRLTFQQFPLAGADSYGGVWTDYDGDGDLDLFVGHTSTFSDLMRNEGNREFVRMHDSGISQIMDGFMGAWGDYDNDGDMDLYIAAGRIAVDDIRAVQNRLFKNEGDGTFTMQPITVMGDRISDRPDTSYGAAWGDMDNDGYLDLYVANGGFPSSNPHDIVYHNLGNGTFERIREGILVESSRPTNTPTWVDIDNDGDLDLFVSGGPLWGEATNNPNQFFLNDGNDNHWLRIQCIGAARPGMMGQGLQVSNRSGIGAKVRVQATYDGEARWQMREISGGCGIGNSSPLEAHFGLGDAETIETLRVEWPSGAVQTLNDVAVDQMITISEPMELQFAAPRREGSQVQLQIYGQPNSSVRIQETEDLSHWEDLQTVELGEAGTEITLDATDLLRCFRAVVVQ